MQLEEGEQGSQVAVNQERACKGDGVAIRTVPCPHATTACAGEGRRPSGAGRRAWLRPVTVGWYGEATSRFALSCHVRATTDPFGPTRADQGNGGNGPD